MAMTAKISQKRMWHLQKNWVFWGFWWRIRWVYCCISGNKANYYKTFLSSRESWQIPKQQQNV